MARRTSAGDCCWMRRAREIWVGIIEQWERSELTAEEFGAMRKIPAQRLRWWRWKLGRESEDVPSLVPVRVVASTAPKARRSADDGSGSVEVEFPDGVRLRFATETAQEFVVEIVNRLRRC
jgi:hypothetical protein